MARTFVTASSEYLSVDSSPISAFPFTMACWARTTDRTATQSIMWIGDKDAAENWSGLRLIASAGLRAFMHKNGGAAGCFSDVGTSADNTWHFCCGVFNSATDVDSYIDASSNTNDNGESTNNAPGSYDRVAIGMDRDSTPTSAMNGDIAEPAIWDVALTASEIAGLAAGYSPLFFRPQSLVFYPPLGGLLTANDADYDIVGGLSLTEGGTPTTADHPPIIYPSDPQVGYAVAAGPAPAGTKNLTLLGVG